MLIAALVPAAFAPSGGELHVVIHEHQGHDDECGAHAHVADGSAHRAYALGLSDDDSAPSAASLIAIEDADAPHGEIRIRIHSPASALAASSTKTQEAPPAEVCALWQPIACRFVELDPHSRIVGSRRHARGPLGPPPDVLELKASLLL